MDHEQRVRQLLAWIAGQRWDIEDALLVLAHLQGLMIAEYGQHNASLLHSLLAQYTARAAQAYSKQSLSHPPLPGADPWRTDSEVDPPAV